MAIISTFGISGITSITTSTDTLRVFSSSAAPATILDSSGAFLSLPPGTLIFHCGPNAPAGFLKANGANISRNVYSALFSVLGTTFGVGDGLTTFTLPDMRGEFPRGWDDGRGIDSGRSLGSFQDHALQSHTHTLNANVDYARGSVRPPATDLSAEPRTFTTSNHNGNSAAETRPRNISLLACIKF